MYWNLKLAVKILSGKFPPLRKILKSAGYFRHGKMDSRLYATGVFNRHFRQINPENPAFPKKGGGVCLEIGPGESLLTLILARAAGFSHTVLIDQGSQLAGNLRCYAETAAHLAREGHDLPPISETDSLRDILKNYSSRYLVHGLKSMESLETGSIDFSFSHAVLEHIPVQIVPGYLRELKRVMKIGGISSHVVDLKDHLGGGANQLRFSEAFWESEWIHRSGAYTNRLRLSQWTALFEAAGLEYEITERQYFPALPVERRFLAERFRNLDEEDLRVSGFTVLFYRH